jgi:hypothetical protein
MNASFKSIFKHKVVVILVLFLAQPLIVQAQVHQAWVAHYNNGIPGGTHQVTNMVLDAAGNIYVSGYSQNTNSQLDYVTLKYAPNGNQLWVARYDSASVPQAIPSGFALDISNNVVMTGNAGTVKFDTNANQLWVEPYVGSSVATDTNANVVVAEGSNFSSVKLSPNGSNLWSQTYTAYTGPNLSQIVLVDGVGNIYVLGSVTVQCTGKYCSVAATVVKYDTLGNQLWAGAYGPVEDQIFLLLDGAAIDSEGNIITLVTSTDYGFTTYECSSNGNYMGFAGNPVAPWSQVRGRGLALGAADSVFETGQVELTYTLQTAATAGINSSGGLLWTNVYPASSSANGVCAGMAIAVDSANNSYITGYLQGANSYNAIVTIKYDQNGNQIWLQQYAGAGSTNAVGNAIAVDKNGNVYVAGCDTTSAGGTEMVLIKYSQVTLQPQSNGSFLLQAQGAPGEDFMIEGSTDLETWLNLGTVVADGNGVAQFYDTNASNFNSRFYQTVPQ